MGCVGMAVLLLIRDEAAINRSMSILNGITDWCHISASEIFEPVILGVMLIIAPVHMTLFTELLPWRALLPKGIRSVMKLSP